MKVIRKIFIIPTSLLGLLFIWYWLDNNDYFQSDYKDLTTEQEKIFKWNESDDENTIKERYRNYFTNKEYAFPRQKTSKVKLFVNKPLIGLFTDKTLKKIEINNFINFCNESTNFDWGETTWETSESEYYFKLYNENNKVIGKIYFCLNGCGMTSSRPFCPTMKFGGLSEKGQKQIEKLINNKTSWD